VPVLVSLVAALACAEPSSPAFVVGTERPGRSPYEAVSTFLDLCRAGAHAEAAQYLSLTPEQSERGGQWARRLKAVLDRHLWVDLAEVATTPEGDLQDGLPPDTERLGDVPTGPRRVEPVLLSASEVGGVVRWRFSAQTVGRIDAWYQALPGRWWVEHLPEPLQRPGPWELLWWQWLGVALLAPVSLLLGRTLGWATRRLLGRALPSVGATRGPEHLAGLGGPLTLLWTAGVATATVPFLSLYTPAEGATRGVLRAISLVAVLWVLWRAVGLAADAVLEARAHRLTSPARTLVSMGARVARTALVVAAVIGAMQAMGIAVTGVLAGLGIGGLAMALAAQKSVENLFGGVALAVDSPFGVGDFVRVEDFVGTVESVGLRTTRFRTLDRTVITIPNGRLADMRLESFSARDRLRLDCTVGLTYDTTAEQMSAVLQGLETVLRAHPKTWHEAVVVRFKELGGSSLDIEVMAWFETTEWSEFQAIRQAVLLDFMAVVERAGASFAFPTQTLHVVQG
jgi:MscS family membrane protein